MDDNAAMPQIIDIRLFEDALSVPLFERLVRAFDAIGDERLKENYATTFWFPRDAEPSNLAEEIVVELLGHADPGPECIGMEWWLGRLGYGKKLSLHFDRDLALKEKTGQSIHPLLSSVFYVNAFPSAPTMILGQVLSADGKTKVPEKPKSGKSVDAVPNQYVVFPGNLRHGVVPDTEAVNGNTKRSASERRLTFLVNYWRRRPLAPICIEYDGTTYSAFKEGSNGHQPS